MRSSKNYQGEDTARVSFPFRGEFRAGSGPRAATFFCHQTPVTNHQSPPMGPIAPNKTRCHNCHVGWPRTGQVLGTSPPPSVSKEGERTAGSAVALAASGL